VIELMEIYH